MPFKEATVEPVATPALKRLLRIGKHLGGEETTPSHKVEAEDKKYLGFY